MPDDRQEAESERALLIRLARSRDQAAVKRIIEICRPGILRTLRSVLGRRSKADYEDVEAEAILALLTSLNELKAEMALLPFARRIAHHKAVDFLRKHAKPGGSTVPLSEEHGALASLLGMPSSTPEEQVGRRDLVKKLIPLLEQRLSEKEYVFYKLYFMDKRSIAQISKQLGEPPNRLYVRLHGIRTRARSILEELMAVSDGNRSSRSGHSVDRDSEK